MNQSLNEKQLGVLRFGSMCFACGYRLGLHRWGDNACPNRHWQTGNGHPQWREGWRFKEAR